MNAIENVSHSVQRTVCMFLSALIVSSTLTLGAYAAQSPERTGIVTVTQLA